MIPDLDALIERARVAETEIAGHGGYDNHARTIADLAMALQRMREEIATAWHEASCCDDINLDQSLASIISNLQSSREAAEARIKVLEAERDEAREQFKYFGALHEQAYREQETRADKAESDLATARAELADRPTTIAVEKLLLAKLGREWTPSGISIASLIDELAARASLETK